MENPWVTAGSPAAIDVLLSALLRPTSLGIFHVSVMTLDGKTHTMR